MKAKTCILIYVDVSAHLLSRNLSNACSVPRIVLDAGFQHSHTECRTFSHSVHVNVYVHVYVYGNYSVSFPGDQYLFQYCEHKKLPAADV